MVGKHAKMKIELTPETAQKYLYFALCSSRVGAPQQHFIKKNPHASY